MLRGGIVCARKRSPSTPDYSLPSPWLDENQIKKGAAVSVAVLKMKIDSSSTDSVRRTKKGKKKGNNQYQRASLWRPR